MKKTIGWVGLMLVVTPVVAGDGWGRGMAVCVLSNEQSHTQRIWLASTSEERIAQLGASEQAPVATQYSPPEILDPVVVEAERPSLTQENLSSAEERLRLIPGGVNLIGPRELEEKRPSSLVDALGAQPGIIARSFFGGNDQARLNIRGSGLQQNPVQRGVRLLLDGLPVNLADGSFIIGVLEPRTTQYIEVYRGANGARYGATTLGGAINFIAPTGYDHDFSRLALEGGSFGFASALAATGGRLGIKTLPNPTSALSNVPLSQDVSGFIAAGGTVYISPFTLRDFAASPEMLADGVTVPKDPPAVHRHMFDPATQSVVW
ncbi:MAG: TonB-dependent receptor plug domain-containing protein [Gammaproteobacteria bacterium]